MGYRIFYSYQSDIDKNLNQKFIRKAINEAIIKIKDYEIEELVEGFYGIGGNPPLAEKMLQQSENSDIFIGDVTFTSSKVWHNPIYRFEDDNSILIEIEKGDLKPSPNPNVLIETGYSWAQKKYERTILVMNTAFGFPDALPVDMGDKRHPITYNLSNERYDKEAKRNKEFNALSEALHDAILTVIKSDAEYQRKKWAPILLHKNWSQRDFNTLYRPTLKAKQIISQLRIDLNNTERPQRLVGPKNSGKTRLVYELYKKIDDTLPMHEHLEKVLYYDLDGGDYRDIEVKLQDLKELNQRKILVLDNCPIKIHNRVFDQLFFDSKVSLLTIGNTEDGEGASHFIDIDYANEVIEKLSNETGNTRNTNFILENANSNLRNAIAMIGKIPEGEEGLSADYKIKWEQILGEDLFSTEVLNVLEELSLFTHVGFLDRYQYQSELIIQKAGIKSREKLEFIIDKLTEKGIVKITGDFLILEVFVEELSFKRLERLALEDLDEYFNLITLHKLSKQFSNRLVELNKLKSTHNLIDILTLEGGLFKKIEFINSDQGARILMSLAEIEPEKILQTLEAVLGNKTLEELKEFEKGRRYIVWTLERLIYRKSTFEGAATLLFKLSVAENEEIANNATSQFCQLFQIYLPATTATLEERLSLLGKLIKNIKKEEKKVVKRALERALMVKSFTRMGGAEKQAGETFQDYQPKNRDEILNYWKTIIEMLVGLNEYGILVNRFSAQVHEGNSSAIIEAIEKRLEEEGVINKDLRQQFDFLMSDKLKVDAKKIQKIEELLDKYSENTIRENLLYKVALAPYSTYRNKEGEIINKSEEKVKEFAKEIIEEGSDNWLNDLDVLLHNEQHFTFIFGQKIAQLRPDYQDLIDSVIKKLCEIPFTEQNNSLISGYLNGIDSEEFKRNTIDLYLSKDEISHNAVHLTTCLDIQLSDLEKLYHLVSSNPNYLISLQYLQLKNLSENEFISFINWLKEIKGYGWWTSIDLCRSNLEKKDILSEPILDLVRNLLMKENILSGNNSLTSFSIINYVDLFKKYQKQNLDVELVEFLANEIIMVSKEISLNHEYHLIDILEILFEKKWDETWSVLSASILKSDFYGWYNLKDLLKKYKEFDSNKLLEWMDKYPEVAPQKALSFIQLVVNEEGEEKWSPLVLEILNRYVINDKLLSVLSSDLHSYFWSGSIVPLLESRKNLVEQLLAHPKEEIIAFAKENISYFEDKIKREKRSDENYGLELY